MSMGGEEPRGDDEMLFWRAVALEEIASAMPLPTSDGVSCATNGVLCVEWVFLARALRVAQ